MKKLFFVIALFIFNCSLVFAISERDKLEIESIIDNNYKYSRNLIEARNRARDYVDREYMPKYIKCKNNCEIEMEKVRVKANKANIFSNLSNIQSEAVQTFYECMDNSKCKEILEIQSKECYDYIEKYVDKKYGNKRK